MAKINIWMERLRKGPLEDWKKNFNKRGNHATTCKGTHIPSCPYFIIALFFYFSIFPHYERKEWIIMILSDHLFYRSVIAPDNISNYFLNWHLIIHQNSKVVNWNSACALGSRPRAFCNICNQCQLILVIQSTLVLPILFW